MRADVLGPGAAECWGEEQEALVRQHNWVDPHAGDVSFGEFAERWMSVNRFAINTEAKYRSHLRCHLLPQGEDWPLGAIFHDHSEVQGWVNELHEDLAEWTVASVFATFSTIMNVAVRARKIPAKRVFTGARGGELRRSNFTRRFWRPAWDGDPTNLDHPLPPILAGFTFHEGRHLHRTWLADDSLPDAAQAARLGHKLPGMANIYEHVTEEAKQRVLAALQARWEDSVRQLSDDELRHLLLVVPADLRPSITQRD
ncbi:hypothetical protein [Spirillospora sp. CA-294931]|uniref:hypothetical protein n=1 Tax=Spirillospora sp. CA-294931 TaxID=3240042 RepID=UPI003D92CCE9